MGNIGAGEIIVVLIIALIVIGPEEAARRRPLGRDRDARVQGLDRRSDALRRRRRRPSAQVALRISRQLLDDIVEHARAEAPKECCGMVASRDGEAVAVHRARNAANSALRYVMDPMEQYKLQEAIDDAGLELGAIYHSHTRSDPIPSETDINLARLGDSDQPAFPGTLVPDRRREGPRGRSAPVVDRRQPGRAGRDPGVGMSLVCPDCDRVHPGSERFCDACGLPLVHAAWLMSSPTTELAIRARKVRPGYAEGPLGARRRRPPPGRGGDDPGPAAGGGHPVRRPRAPAASTSPTSSPPARATSSSPPRARRPPARSWPTAARAAASNASRGRSWVRALALSLAMVPIVIIATILIAGLTFD